jgi:hypothetical protein
MAGCEPDNQLAMIARLRTARHNQAAIRSLSEIDDTLLDLVADLYLGQAGCTAHEIMAQSRIAGVLLPTPIVPFPASSNRIRQFQALLRGRQSGADLKPPQAAVVKSDGGEPRKIGTESLGN